MLTGFDHFPIGQEVVSDFIQKNIPVRQTPKTSHRIMKIISKLGFMPILLGLSLVATTAYAQRGGNFDPSQFMDRMVDRYQEGLEVSDDEWSVLKPLVAKIVEKQFTGRGRGFGGFGGGRGGRGGRGGDGDRQADRGQRGQRGQRGGGGGGNSATEDLRNAIEAGDAAKIKSELASYRAAQKKSAAELSKARNELRQLLTVKQEANMVVMGLLD